MDTFNEALNLLKDNYIFSITRQEAENRILKEELIYKKNKDLLDDFIDICKDYLDSNENKVKYKNLTLSNENKLYNFFLDENTEYGKFYREIYKEFIKIQNEEITKLLDLKIEEKIFDKNCKKTIGIQTAQKDDIFLLKQKQFSFIDIIFNCSYRKVSLTDDSDNLSYIPYNDFEINYDLIEEKMTEQFLSNKKLFNDSLNYFIYKNDFTFEEGDIITRFNQLYMTKSLFIDDKIILNKFNTDNNSNVIMRKNIINDYKTLLLYLIEQKENIKKETKISDILKDLKQIKKISDDFVKIFEKSELIVEKTSNLFEYYLMLIFSDLNEEMEKYKAQIDDEKKESIEQYFYKKEILITKDIFVLSIRLFISLFLFNEKDKEKKIKENFCNIINYFLKIPDLWNSDFMKTRDIYNFKKEEWKSELEEIQKLDIKMNQLIELEELLGKDFEEKYFEDLKKEIEKRKREEEEQKKFNDEVNKEKKLNIENEEKVDEKEKDEEEEKEEEEEEEENNRYNKRRRKNSDSDDSDRE